MSTQLLSSGTFPVPVVVVECCLTSTETSRINVCLNQTVGLLGTGAQDVHLDFVTQLLSSNTFPGDNVAFILASVMRWR